jgi:hypothetical protein
VAVVQISRIQVRRGQKNQGSGLPQLASGELGWAIDTRELYIGNGAVSEGAPAVGNTKVLTEYDNIFTLADTYAYRENDPYIVTGADASTPHTRSLQDRLDDIVSVRSFGLTGLESQDATVKLQQALDQLYLNSATKGSEQSRVVLHLEPGIYKLTNTVYIPPHATIVGAGPEKTVIKQTASDAPIFQTVNDSSTPGNPADDSSSTFINQARNIHISGMTLENTGTGKGLILQSCRDSVFENIDIVGTWEQGDSGFVAKRAGLELNSLSGSVESSTNKFVNCKVTGFDYGVISDWDIDTNDFNKCEFSTLGYGVVFGETMSLGSSGQLTGPVRNTFTKCIFKDIDRHALWINNGQYNTSANNQYISVGNEAGNEGQPVYSVIKFNNEGNNSNNDYFSRTEALSYNQSYIVNVPYIPEVEGPANVTWANEHTLNITSGSDTVLFRLPQMVEQAFEIDYLLVSNNYEMLRTGTLYLVVDSRGETVEVSDEYHHNGDELYLDSIQFSAILVDADMDGTKETIEVKYTNTISGDDTDFKFKVKTKQTSIS